MNLFKLSFSYLRRRWLNTLLNVLLLSFGIATIVVLLLFSYQVEDNLYKNAEGVDVVVGAKGSPIQLILSSIFHIDAPTGNVDLHEAKELMENPSVREVIPLALGDNYRGYRIVGTTTAYIEKYGGNLSEGTLWDHEFEVVAGAAVAKGEGLAAGDTFVSSHGFDGAGHSHEDQDLVVVGVLEPTGSVLDRLLLTGVETMWGIHGDTGNQERDEEHDHEHEEDHEHNEDHEHGEEHEHDDEHEHVDTPERTDHHEHSQVDDHTENDDHHHDGERDHSDHDESEIAVDDSNSHDGHEHPKGRNITDSSYLSDEYRDKQITSMLVRYSNPLAAAQFPRFVNAETNMQAAAPAVEITRLLGLLGVGLDAIEVFAYILILASILGIFIAMINSMKERKYDLAIMRTLGGSRLKLFAHVILEGILVAFAGTMLGIGLGHLAVEGIGTMMEEVRQFDITGLIIIPGEAWILILAIFIGLIAALVPAVRAYQTDIADTLSKT